MPDTVMQSSGVGFATQSSSIAQLAKALAEAQKSFTPIPKDREVTVQSDRGKYKFKYATLDAIRTSTMPALSDQGLAIVQGMVTQGNGYAIETRLLHSSGEWVSNVTPMFISGRVKDGRQYPPTNQELGSAQSYARRYGLSALICITADEDDDGNTADGNHVEGSQREPYRPAAGSAGAGGDLRPDGPRRFTGPIRSQETMNEIERDGLKKPETPKAAAPAGESTTAKKAKTWVDNAIGTIRLPGQHVASLDKWWRDQEKVPAGAKLSPLGWLQEAEPAEFERLQTAFDEVRSHAKEMQP